MEAHRVYQGRKFEIWVEPASGRGGQPIPREVIRHPGSVVILPWVDADTLCLVRNRRPGVGKTLLELPAGTLTPGEPPLAAAQRELAEETGYSARTWRPLTWFYPSPGLLSEIMHLYVATDLTPGSMRLEADEDLEPVLVSWSQALGWLQDGTLRDAKTMIGLLLWERQRGVEDAGCGA
jgi:ADP-ribose pyrophosphatase